VGERYPPPHCLESRPMKNVVKQEKDSTPRSFLFLLFIILIGVGIFTPGQASQNKVLARVDEKKITQKDFDAYLALFEGNSRYLPRTREDKKRLLQHLIDRTILLEAAKKEGYFKQKIFKKHPLLTDVEKETFILRAYLMDHVSKKAAVTSAEVAAYQKLHPGVSSKKAKEFLIAKRQKVLFAALMKQLKKGRKIRTYPEKIK